MRRRRRGWCAARSCASSRPARRRRSSIVERESCYLARARARRRAASARHISTSRPATSSSPRIARSAIRACYDDVARFAPREAIVPRDDGDRRRARRSRSTPVEPSLFETRGSHDYLSKHFGTQSLRGFGLEGDDPRIGAAGGALRYASREPRKPLDHVRVAARRQRRRLSAARRGDAGEPRRSSNRATPAARAPRSGASSTRRARRWARARCAAG